MRLLYTFSIYLYFLLISLASIIGNRKAKQWLKGRKRFFSENAFNIQASNIIWIHAASLGEFEQGRPLIEAVKKKHPQKKILLSFFSPSGYEIRKDYEHADYVVYLPLDTRRNARRFIELFKPELVIFVKYEFWFNFLHELHIKAVPAFIISAIFRKNQVFFKFYSSWFRKQLQVFDYFFVQNFESKSLLRSIGFDNIEVVGDTRFDRVFKNSKSVTSYPLIEKFIGDSKVVIGGSTWPKDEEFLAEYSKKQPNVKFIIAPHLVDEQHILQTLERFGKKAVLFSELGEMNNVETNILIINNIGHLSNLYQYGKIAHIGGGFGKGIHNTLEAATFKLPVTFGPNYRKFQEAKDLIDEAAAFEVKCYSNFETICNKLLFNEDVYTKSSQAAQKYVEGNIGATELILDYVDKAIT